MQSLGSVYKPLVRAAIAGVGNPSDLLGDIGRKISDENPDFCLSLDDGVSAAKYNLRLYCQDLDSDISFKVMSFFGI